MDHNIDNFNKFKDLRGDVVVFLRKSDLKPKLGKFGQIYFVTFEKKNVVRGNHYHKKNREWFGIISGKLDVYLKDVRTEEEKRMILDSNSKKYVRLEIGPYIAHSFKNVSKKATLINYTNLEWSAKDTFTYKLF